MAKIISETVKTKLLFLAISFRRRGAFLAYDKVAKLNKSVIFFLIILATLPSIAEACGKERWDVKVVTDKDMARIEPIPVPTKIFKLTTIDAPVNPTIRSDSRYAPTELTTYEITGTLTMLKKEGDGDYHMVIEDEKGRSMIIEAVDPTCAEASRFKNEITEIRNIIDQEISGTQQSKNSLHRVVTVTGVGFFDRIHGQSGVAPNGIELHPVLSIVFHQEPTVQRYRANVQSIGRDSAD